MVNLTNDEFAVIKAILKTVADNCNYYWTNENKKSTSSALQR